jgi:thymidine phosphorylase
VSSGPFDPRVLVRAKLGGGELAPEDLKAFVAGVVDESVDDPQAAALLAAIYARGLSNDELVALTLAMTHSGSTLSWDADGGPVVDKHSTGGVGDKASLPLAPALAACGLRVPMLSGRGLGHTGGTLDKLESIPGFRTDLDEDSIRSAVASAGCVITGQTKGVAPADRRLYALRDATGLVESLPLIASSILSKKLAEGIGALVLDVKYGSGAFLPDPDAGAELARTMVDLARGAGVDCVALQTAMDRPLGLTCGNALEVAESVDCLRGSGPRDLRELVCLLGGELLALTGVSPDAFVGGVRIGACLDDGSAMEQFILMVEAQGGDASAALSPHGLPQAPAIEVIEAEGHGRMAWADVRALGEAVVALGGGRRRAGDAVDSAVGLRILALPGDALKPGTPLVELHHRDGAGLEQARALCHKSLNLGGLDSPQGPLLLARF